MSVQEKSKLEGHWTIDKFDDPNGQVAKYLQQKHNLISAKIRNALKINDAPPRTVEQAKLKFAGRHLEHIDMGDNLMLDNGITVLLNLLIGAAATNFSITNARLTVGTGTTAAVATNTALTTFAFGQGVDAGYPTVSAQAVTFQITVASANGNVSWQEFGADNYAATSGTGYTTTAPTYTTSLVLLDHLVSNQSTKVSGQTWILKLTISES